MFQSKGKLRYSPKLIGDQPQSPNWWLICDTDPEIGKYYRHLFLIEHYRCRTLQRPAWESHITVIRNEEPPNKALWEKYNGLEITFNVQPQPKTNGEYCWLGVESEQLFDLRLELGLPREPYYPFHLSIGHGTIDPSIFDTN